VQGIHERAENISGKFDFIVSRAVTAMPSFLLWTKGKFKLSKKHTLPNGILYLKGGDLSEEMQPVKQKHSVHSLSDFFSEDFFETKKVVYVKGN
jgi:16S rRNA (guanine527-N7)-methyltransferase